MGTYTGDGKCTRFDLEAGKGYRISHNGDYKLTFYCHADGTVEQLDNPLQGCEPLESTKKVLWNEHPGIEAAGTQYARLWKCKVEEATARLQMLKHILLAIPEEGHESMLRRFLWPFEDPNMPTQGTVGVIHTGDFFADKNRDHFQVQILPEYNGEELLMVQYSLREEFFWRTLRPDYDLLELLPVTAKESKATEVESFLFPLFQVFGWIR